MTGGAPPPVRRRPDRSVRAHGRAPATRAGRSGPPRRPPRPATHARRVQSPSRRGRTGRRGLQRRLVAFLVVACLLFVVLGVRLAFVQGVTDDRYAAFGASQRFRRIELPAARGAIFDRNGRDLALTVNRKTVWVNPRLVTDPADQARQLAPVLGQPEDRLRDRLTMDKAFVYLARKVDDAVAARVDALRLPGIGLIDEPKRFAPAGALALPLLGTVGTDNAGLAGLEHQYEEALRGTPGSLVAERAPDGRQIPTGERHLVAPEQGQDLVLTIDRSLQYETERALGQEIVRSNSNAGIAIVSDPRTGEILAMANLVRDPSTGAVRPAESNRAVTHVYEPGSVNKLITVAAGLEEGIVAPSTVMQVADNLRIADKVFHDHDPHPTEPWSVTEIVANSSNVGSIMIGQRLGKERLDRYVRAFGLGRTSGLGFPGESAGIVLDPKDWSKTSMGTVPIGQGIAVTALQMLGAYNTIANGGTWVAPRLVRETVDATGRRRPAPAPATRRVVSERTAAQMTAMLREVVRAGTGTKAAIDGYVVAGKTGTARKPLEGRRGYKPGAYIASFAGFVPAQSPRLSAIVMLDEPTPIYGGETAAPVFATINRYALRLLRIPPPAGGLAVTVPHVRAAADARPDGEVDAATPPERRLVTAPPATAPPTTAPPASGAPAAGADASGEAGRP